jgi:pimeloyl-ACP methyl ester carboxylesterase
VIRQSRRALVAALAVWPTLARGVPPAGGAWSDQAFRSDDGALIHYRRLGAGPGVVIVHGAFDEPRTWYPVAERLAGRFTFFILRRRGWLSPPPDDGTRPFEREKADIARLLAIAGPGASLFGHSAGGALAADFARTHALPGRLILFDPALPLSGTVAGGLMDELSALVAQGRQNAAFKTFLDKIVQVDPERIAALAGTPDFNRQAAMMNNGLRELAALDALPRDPRAWAAIAAPTWLIEGELSPEHPFHDAARALERVIPQVKVKLLKGQGHMGMAAAPDEFATLLGECLTA